MKKLPAKRQRFVDEYLIDGNATRAYKAAGYRAKTDSVAAVEGGRLLRIPYVAGAIEAGQGAKQKRAHVTADDVLRELAILAISNVKNFTVDEYGELGLAEGAPEEAWRAVSSMKVTSRIDEHGNVIGRQTEFKLWDKPESVRMLGQHFAMFVERKMLANDPDNPLPKAAEVHIYLPDNGRDAKGGDDE